MRESEPKGKKPPAPTAKALTPKQRLFAAEYLKDLNATQAAKRAGYTGEFIDRLAWKLSKKPQIKALIEKGIADRAKRTGITADEVIENVLRISRSAEGVNEFGVAMKGQELLGKHLKLFTDKLEIKGKITLEQLVAGANDEKGTEGEK